MQAVYLMGPTGAGKTDAAAALAEALPLEIVSVDSALVFRGMDIGTAKPDAALRARLPHHLIDLIDPTEAYSAGRFLADCRQAMADVRSRGRVPMLVGGTMLYFRALQSGLAEMPVRDEAVRRSIELRAAAQGWPALHAELAGKDPLAAARIQPADRQRIQRALEVIEITGKPLSSLQREDLRGGEDADALKLVLAPADRAAGVAVLAGRLERMMERGFLAEVESLHARGDLGPDLPSIRCVGYRQLWAFLEGQSTLPEAVERAQIATRQLAKRQLTWLRAEPGAEWVDALDTGAIAHIKERVETWLGRFGSTATL